MRNKSLAEKYHSRSEYTLINGEVVEKNKKTIKKENEYI